MGFYPFSPAPVITGTGAEGQVLTSTGPSSAAWKNAPVDWVNAVTAQGANPFGTADTVTRLQATIGALPALGGTAYTPAGTYLCTAASLEFTGNGQQLEGAGANTTEISQTTATQHGITSAVTSGLYDLGIRKLTVNGPGATENAFNGIYLVGTTGNIEGFQIANARVQFFGNDGIDLSSPINSKIGPDVIVQHVGNIGIAIIDGTSTNCDSVYVRSQAGIGFFYSGTAYSALTGCACDFGEWGYQLKTVNGVTLSGCGCESQTVGGFEVTNGSVGAVLEGCYNIANPGIACWVTGDSTATIIGFREINPAAGATASIQVDAGSSATIIDPVLVTAPNYQGDVTVISNGTVTCWAAGAIVATLPA